MIHRGRIVFRLLAIALCTAILIQPTLAVTTQHSTSLPPVDQITFAYESGTVRVVAESVLIGSEASGYAAQPFASIAGLVAAENSTALVKYDSSFAAKQMLGQPNVTPGGHTISGHAADRMMNGGLGRRPMTIAEVDQVLDEGNVIKKIDMNHPRGPTFTIQDTTMHGMPQVVVDQATGSRIVTVIQPTGTRTRP